MDEISRRLGAMPLRLIVVLQMMGELLEWLEQDGGGRGGGGGGGGGGMVWGGVGGMGDFVAWMKCVDRFLRSVLVGRLDSGRHLLEELLFLHCS